MYVISFDVLKFTYLLWTKLKVKTQKSPDGIFSMLSSPPPGHFYLNNMLEILGFKGFVK